MVLLCDAASLGKCFVIFETSGTKYAAAQRRIIKDGKHGSFSFYVLSQKTARSGYYLPHVRLSIRMEQIGSHWKDFHEFFENHAVRETVWKKYDRARQATDDKVARVRCMLDN